MHLTKRHQYCYLIKETKTTFFNITSSVGSQATSHAFAGFRTLPIRVLFDSPIAIVIIGEMMIRQQDIDVFFSRAQFRQLWSDPRFVGGR